MKKIEIELYKFTELPEEIQQKVLDKYSDINTCYDWWEYQYEDAKNVGLEITRFDLDRNNYCNGEFIEDACYTAHKIKCDHGKECKTYETAIEFLKNRDYVIEQAEKDENGNFVNEYALDKALDICEDDFLNSILEDYKILLRKEHEYLTSKEAIIETIEANDYDFTIEGEIY